MTSTPQTGPAEKLPDRRPVTGPSARDVLRVSPAPVMPPTRAGEAATPQQLAAMSDLIRATLPARLAEAVVADAQWPATAVHLHRADRLFTAGGLAAALGSLGDQIDPAGHSPARSLLQALHASTAASLGTRLASQTHTADRSPGRRSRQTRSDPRPPPAPTLDRG